MNAPLTMSVDYGRGTLVGGYTAGPWRPGKHPHTIIADQPIQDGPPGCDDTSYYGGHLIAESVATCNVPAVAAAPALLQALHDTAGALHALLTATFHDPDFRVRAQAQADAADILINKVLRGECP